MDYKSYFKPNRSKILISLLLVVISYLIVFVLLPYTSRYFYIYSNPVTLLFYNIPIYFTLLIFVLLSYPFGCYIGESKAWFKGILFFLAAFIIASFVLFSAITGYNNTAGAYCKVDSDCHYDIWTCQSVNNKHVSLRDPFLMINCNFGSAICENKKCETFHYKDAQTIKDCERITDFKSSCYYSLAKKLNDASLCEKIEENDFKKSCIKEVEEAIRIEVLIRSIPKEVSQEVKKLLNSNKLCLIYSYSSQQHGLWSATYIFDDGTLFKMVNGKGDPQAACELTPNRFSQDTIKEWVDAINVKDINFAPADLTFFYAYTKGVTYRFPENEDYHDFSVKFRAFEKNTFEGETCLAVLDLIKKEWNFSDPAIKEDDYAVSADKLDAFAKIAYGEVSSFSEKDYSLNMYVLFIDSDTYYLFPDPKIIGSRDAMGILTMSKEYNMFSHRIIVSSNGTLTNFKDIQKKVENSTRNVYIFVLQKDGEKYYINKQ